MATIQNFYTVAQQHDFARTFQFKLREFANISFDSNHFAYVETASLPGRQITNITVPYMGLDLNTPGTVKYPGSSNYNVQFRCDQQYNIRAALEAASFQLFDESTSSGTYGVPSDGTTLVLELVDKLLQPVRIYTLFGVWIQTLADAAFDIKDSGAIQVIPVTLSYQYWRATNASGAVYNPATTFDQNNRGLVRTSTTRTPAGGLEGEVTPRSW